MVESAPESIRQAAHALALDAATAEAVRALDERSIPCLLLKGPAIAHWVYANERDGRTYTDVDVLVQSAMFEVAEEVLEDLGYDHEDGGHRVGPRTWLHESAWSRSGPPPAYVDLHRGFHGVNDWNRWWTVMAEHTVAIEVGGHAVRIPDAAGCALVVALHDSSTGRTERSGTDLRRALSVFADEVWQDAARRAEAIGVRPSLVLGLSHHAGGRQLVARLSLPTDLPPDVAIRSLVTHGAKPGSVDRAWALQFRLESARGWRERVRLLLDIVFPAAEFFRQSRPLARRGGIGLVAARAFRPFDLALRAPRILWLLGRGRRRAHRSGHQSPQ